MSIHRDIFTVYANAQWRLGGAIPTSIMLLHSGLPHLSIGAEPVKKAHAGMQRTTLSDNPTWFANSWQRSSVHSDSLVASEYVPLCYAWEKLNKIVSLCAIVFCRLGLRLWSATDKFQDLVADLANQTTFDCFEIFGFILS